MKFSRSAWAESFRIDQVPHWICPICNHGSLLLDQESLKVHETRQSLEKRQEIDWEEWDVEKHFNATFRCSNPVCKELVFVIGDCKYEQDTMAYVEERKDGYHDHLYPRYTQPRLKIVSEADEIPVDVVIELERVNELFWVDKSACANAIRTVVEVILTEERIRKTFTTKKGSRKKLTLHERIQKFRMKNPFIAELLEAIKWVGNSGSHTERIDHEELLDGILILWRVLEFLYPDGDETPEELAQAINKRNRRKPHKNA
jgi:hypothetical protein